MFETPAEERIEQLEDLVEALRTYLQAALSELDSYYVQQYSGDHPHTVKNLADARNVWRGARAVLNRRIP